MNRMHRLAGVLAVVASWLSPGAATAATGNAEIDHRFDGTQVELGRMPGKPSFLLCDPAARSGFALVKEDAETLGVRVRAARRSDDGGAMRFGVSLESDGSRDRVLTLVYAVPLEKGNWVWCDGPRKATPLDELTADPFLGADAAVGARGQSLMPFGCACNGKRGVALGIAPNHPAVYRVSANRRARVLYMAFDIALTAEKPMARFGFAEFGFAGENGFRGALEEYMRLYPAAFEVRARKQGIWMPFTKISEVQGFEDFGFMFKEGDNEPEWDDRHGIMTFHYTEPCTWWMKMERTADGSEPTMTDFLAEAKRLQESGDPCAKRFFPSQMQGADGRPMGAVRNTAWCNGIAWAVNDAPGVGGAGGDAAAKIGEDAITARYPAREGSEGLDGEYVDSSELYVSPHYDFNRANFAGMDTPLTFARETLQPAIYTGLIAFEYCRAVAGSMHGRGKLAMANAGPTKWCWNALQMDVMGTETNWRLRGAGGRWTPPPDDEMIAVRAIVGAKPYCYLMNTDFSKFSHADSERYFNRCLAYGFYPGYFSANAATGKFFANPKLYEGVRDLYRKYLPVIRRVAESGWRPVNRLLAVDPKSGILAEQFGDRYVTVFNPSRTETRQFDLKTGAHELLSGGAAAGRIVLQPETCQVLDFCKDRNEDEVK